MELLKVTWEPINFTLETHVFERNLRRGKQSNYSYLSPVVCNLH
jgi:hypothetical protein